MNENNLQRNEFLGKWLSILFLMIIPSTVAGFMTNETIVEWIPYLSLPGQILNIFCLAGYGFILLKLSSENEHYRVAGICALIAGAISVVLMLVSNGADVPVWTLLISLPALVLDIIGEYNEYKGHSEILRDVNVLLSEKWDTLWKWFVGMFLVMFGSIAVVFVVPMLGLLFVIVGGIGTIVISIVKLVYLYKTAKVFKEVAAE